MSRVAYFKAANQNSLDENQNQLIQTLQGQYSTLSTAVDAKAEQSVVAAALLLKADASALVAKANASDVSSALAAKADAAAVNDAIELLAPKSLLESSLVSVNGSISQVSTSLAGKANASALTSINNDISTLTSSVSGKLDSAVHATRVAAENAFFGAFKECVYLSNANNTGEFDYVTNGLVAPQ